MNYKEHFYHVIVALDQLLNTITGGYSDETFSSRSYRMATKENSKLKWRIIRRAVNCIFFWQKDHCYSAFTNELSRKQSPEELK